MKFCLISCASSIANYSVKNGKAYLYGTQKPYSHHHSINNDCFLGFWNFPFLFDGDFINVNKLPNGLPDVDYDVIMYANDSDKNIYTVDHVRNKYPNAKIIFSIKEMSPNIDKFKRSINKCDVISIPYYHVKNVDKYKQITDKPIHTIPQPINIDKFRHYFLVEKELKIFSYVHHMGERRGKTKSFIQHISKKYDIPVVEKVTRGKNQLLDFVNSWKDCMFLFNLDSSYNFGQQATNCASLGTINVGGNNDANHLLYPTLLGDDFDRLESEFNKILNDGVYKQSLVDESYSQLQKTYSFESVRNVIIDLVKG